MLQNYHVTFIVQFISFDDERIVNIHSGLLPLFLPIIWFLYKQVKGHFIQVMSRKRSTRKNGCLLVLPSMMIGSTACPLCSWLLEELKSNKPNQTHHRTLLFLSSYLPYIYQTGSKSSLKWTLFWARDSTKSSWKVYKER